MSDTPKDNKSMTRREIIREVAKATHYTIDDVETVVDCLEQTVLTHLCAGQRVNFYGFGTYNLSVHKGFTRTNPRTGEPWAIDEHVSVHFKPSRSLSLHLKKRLNDWGD